MQPIRASSDDAPLLTEIAFSAKRFWGYPESWMEQWREALTISSEYIRDHETYKVAAADGVLGFYALSQEGQGLVLEHLWVLPKAMGRGVGRLMFHHALGQARLARFSSIEVESDPNAEGFYLRMGARRVGSRTTEWDGILRTLPLLTCSVEVLR